MPPPPPPYATTCTPVTNAQCDALAAQFNVALQPYGGAALVLPTIGYPEQNALFPGVCTIAHTTAPAPASGVIQGYTSHSPLAAVALFSTECAQGSNGGPPRQLNLYEAMVPDTAHPSVPQTTSAELYANRLSRSELSVAGNHYHWNGMQPWMAAIHHQQFNMAPSEFVTRTTRAYADAMPPGAPM